MAIKDLEKYGKAGMKLLEQEANSALDTAARTAYAISQNKATVAKGLAGAWLIDKGVEEDSTILTIAGAGLTGMALLGARKMKKDFDSWDVDEFIKDIPEAETK